MIKGVGKIDLPMQTAQDRELIKPGSICQRIRVKQVFSVLVHSCNRL